jgi:hypothetical protein
MRQRVALGFRAHSGWAVVVAVAGSIAEPIVLDRRRIITADPAIPGSKQPYHAAEPLGIEAAEALIARCRDRSTSLANDAVSAMVSQLASYQVVGAGLVEASGRPLPGLAAILKSHALIHTAEGEFFREVLIRAAEHCSLPITRVKERDIRDLQSKINHLGRTLGPPWTQDEKLASIAAWKALAT